VDKEAADLARCNPQLAASCKQLTTISGEQSSVGRVAGWAVHFDRLLADSAGRATFAVRVDCHWSFFSEYSYICVCVCIRICRFENEYHIALYHLQVRAVIITIITLTLCSHWL